MNCGLENGNFKVCGNLDPTFQSSRDAGVMSQITCNLPDINLTVDLQH